MRYIFRVIGFLLAFVVAAQAQQVPREYVGKVSAYQLAQLTTSGAGKKASSGPSYTGPVDINGAAFAFWGLRAPSGAYANSLGKLANICTPLDAVCADVNSDANGNFNLSGTGSLVCNNIGSICTIKTLYDTSGATNCSAAICDFTQNTIANRPTLFVNCVGSLPCMSCIAASSQSMSVGGSATLASSFSVSTVYRYTGVGTAGWLWADGTNVGLIAANGANTLGIYQGVVADASASSAVHAVQGLFNNASSALYIDGSNTALNAGGGSALNGTMVLCQVGGGSAFITAPVFEFGIWSGSKVANNATMNSNQHTYWGF